MEINFKPIGDKVLIDTAPIKDKTENGILIPDTAKDKPLEGTIVACGTVEKLSVGDEVLFGQYSGSEITLSGKKYLIMREADVYGII